MISQRRFKAIDDYPSKFDWPGIKGLTQYVSRQKKKRKDKTLKTDETRVHSGIRVHLTLHERNFLCIYKGVLCTANKKGGRKRAVSPQCEVRLKMATADFAIMRLTAQPHCKTCIFFKLGAKNFRKPRGRATRNRLVFRDDAEGDWASICRHRENTSRRQGKKLQPLRKPHSASV